MDKSTRNRKDGESMDAEDDTCYGCGPNEWGENSERVWAAVEESVERFVEMNTENIGRSTREKIASASYSGGMIDMVMVIKHALGNWAVGQLLDELERWQRSDDCEDDEGSEVEISIHGGPGDGKVTPEDVGELGEKVSEWMIEKKEGARRQERDPMFA